MKEYIVKADFITEGDELVSPDIVSELIRCKDCKWYEFDVPHRCGYTGLNGYIAEDNFCSKAEPKVTE